MAALLLIEDDPDTIDIYSTILRHHGHDVEVAADGKTGLYRALTEDFDLIVLDIGLPRMSGTEVLHRLRDAENGQDLDILIVSAHGETMEQWSKVQKQASGIITKPVSPDELVRKVERCLAEGSKRNGRGPGGGDGSADIRRSEPEASDGDGNSDGDGRASAGPTVEPAVEASDDPLLLDAEEETLRQDEELEGGA